MLSRVVNRAIARSSASSSKPVCCVAHPALTRIWSPRPSTTTYLFHLASVRTYTEIVIKVPQMAESISEGTLKQWQVKVGDQVNRDDEVVSIETDKIDVAVNCPESGMIREILVEEGSNVTVGQDLALIEVGALGESGGKSEDKSGVGGDSGAPATSEKKEAPKKEGSDVDKAPPKEVPKSEPKPAPAKPHESSAPKESAPSTGALSLGNREERRVKMNRMRMRIAERLKQTQNTIAFVWTMQDIDMTNLMSFRSQYKDEILKQHGLKLGFMGVFARACTLAMREFPIVNASIEDASDGAGGQNIVFHDYVDLSIAVGSGKGLVTPVIRNVESMDVLDIERAIADAAAKARDGKLTIEDMTGGTFTISNGGVYGSAMTMPIVNYPQSALLGLAAIKKRAWVVPGPKGEDTIAVRPIMSVTLAYDHRVMDGREAVQFLVRVKELIEDPRKMLIV